MRKPIIAGNWKMFKTINDGRDLVNSLKRELYDIEGIDTVICPPYTLLTYLADMLSFSNIMLGAQDVHWEDEGAYTGEISAKMLKDAGCHYVIIGHSERRQYFAETNETVNKKTRAALANGLVPIVCVGETLSEREEGKTFDIVKEHIQKGLSGFNTDEILEIIIAYEPVWAIGTGKTATPEQAQEVHLFIRKLLSEQWTQVAADQIRIQYGGSVKPDNIAALMSQEDIDGALVGGASLNSDSFVSIVKKASRRG